MQCRSLAPLDAPLVERLFRDVFARSEGADEGRIVGDLVRELLAEPADPECCGFVAVDATGIAAAVLFSPLHFATEHAVRLLSPLAVRTDRQRQGIGQGLIRFALDELRSRGVAFVITYGDPAFYSRVGFETLSPDEIRAPYPLSRPEGWIGLALVDEPWTVLSGPCTCSAAFADPALW